MVEGERLKQQRTRRLATSLATPRSVRKLQRALHVKAKESPAFRFYALYDKAYRADVLAHAYATCRANGGATGVDGQTFDEIESAGREPWLDELALELKVKRYRPQPVRRVHIPKPDGKQRPLGIPTVKDRVVQTAVMIVLEPIFEADLPSEQYAYRRRRSAHDAISHVIELMQQGYRQVVDADLSGYFDSIPHADLMRCVARRVVDGAVLRLIRMWLDAPVEEEQAEGKRRKVVRHASNGRGTPQGAPLSPLLANLYMRRFVLGWKALGHEARLDARIVNYADDFVICCRANADEALAQMQRMMERLQLTVNPDKTRVCKLPEQRFDFLGYTIGRWYSQRTGRPYIGPRPSKKQVQRMCAAISECTSRRWTPKPAAERVVRLNRMLIGWSNYFSLGWVSSAYRAVDAHARRRLRQWLCHKHGVAGHGTRKFPSTYLDEQLGLVRLQSRRGRLPWANT